MTLYNTMEPNSSVGRHPGNANIPERLTVQSPAGIIEFVWVRFTSKLAFKRLKTAFGRRPRREVAPLICKSQFPCAAAPLTRKSKTHISKRSEPTAAGRLPPIPPIREIRSRQSAPTIGGKPATALSNGLFGPRITLTPSCSNLMTRDHFAPSLAGDRRTRGTRSSSSTDSAPLAVAGLTPTKYGSPAPHAILAA
jgi:hypothetical protein